MEYVNAHGARIPAIGFGTYELEPADAKAMTAHALKTGYRHVDTAQMYENEEAVGAGIRESGVKREDIFLTTKLWIEDFADGDLQQAAQKSLERLNTDYVDLLLLHWPNPDIALAETMDALNDVYDRGWTRHIGVSNFTTEWIGPAVEQSRAPIVTNQVEYHPYLSQRPVLEVLEKKGIALTAYSPLARGAVFSDPTLQRIGEVYGKNPGQVALCWLLQQGNVIALPRSTEPAHVESNFDVFDFALSDDEMREIAKLHSENGRLISPEFAPDWDNAG